MTENTENLVPIKRYRVRQNGIRGQAVSLPKIWTDKQGLRPGDILEFCMAPERVNLSGTDDPDPAESNSLVVRVVRAEGPKTKKRSKK